MSQQWVRFVFAGGGTVDGGRWCHLLADGSPPTYHRFLLRGPALHESWRDDGQRREWDLYLRDGHQEPEERPVYRYAGRQVTGV